jgi:hypothetical protein
MVGALEYPSYGGDDWRTYFNHEDNWRPRFDHQGDESSEDEGYMYINGPLDMTPDMPGRELRLAGDSVELGPPEIPTNSTGATGRIGVAHLRLVGLQLANLQPADPQPDGLQPAGPADAADHPPPPSWEEGMSENIRCPVSYEHCVDYSFSCGHALCRWCYEQILGTSIMPACPLCRGGIS